MIDDIYNKWYYSFSRYAGVAELADAPDLGSGVLWRKGSSPFTRTKEKVGNRDAGFYAM